MSSPFPRPSPERRSCLFRVSPSAVRIALTVLLGLATACREVPSDMGGTRNQTLIRTTLRLRTLDPARAADLPSAMAVSRLYEPLLQYDPVARPYRLMPLLAEAMPERSADGLTYTFRLRSGIRFHDDPCFAGRGGRGREVTAADVVYSWRRIADARTASTGWWLFRDRIEGLDAFRDRTLRDPATPTDAPVAGLQVVDERTVRIRLTRPYPQFLYVLAMPYASVVPREAVEHYGEAFGRHPVGTGPFELEDWRRNYKVVYRRSTSWSGRGLTEPVPPDLQDALAGRGLPGVDRMVDLVMADPSTRWLAFLRGELDLSDISQDQWDVVVDASGALRDRFRDQGMELVTGPALRIDYLAFNMDDPVVGANRALRRAITHAFNTAEWLAFHNHRILRPTGPIPRGLAGYADGPLRFPFDLEAARAALAEAGYPGGIDPATGRRLGLTLEFGRADDQQLRQTAELIRSFLSRIGIELALSFNHAPQFFDKLERRDAQMFYVSWIGDYPDAENFLQLFYGPNASPGPNRCNYDNPAFDALFEQARVMPDSPERTRLYEQLNRMVIDDCPWVFASQPRDVSIQHAAVRNRVHHAFPYGLDKYLVIDR